MISDMRQSGPCIISLIIYMPMRVGMGTISQQGLLMFLICFPLLFLADMKQCGEIVLCIAMRSFGLGLSAFNRSGESIRLCVGRQAV